MRSFFDKIQSISSLDEEAKTSSLFNKIQALIPDYASGYLSKNFYRN